MELYQAIILGILQGLTEFLPVSSSGHLVLGQIFFGITESQLSFDISVHMGTLLAVLVVYFPDIIAILTSVFRYFAQLFSFKTASSMFKEDENLRMAAFIIIGSVPTAIIGLVIKQFEAVLFSSQVLVGAMLIVTGTLLWLSRKYYVTDEKSSVFGIKQAVIIGITQGFAVIPGVSRSGSTIAAGMFLGMNRHVAAKFSFLLSVPAILGAQVLGVKDMIDAGTSIDMITIWATLASFVVGLIALKTLLRLVHAGRFHLFAPYCWIIGTLVLLSKFM
ncbi:MAG: undecaprenyl-diphosphate phosphatase [Proteobacteria bacterium]|nr:undecaprenyl-diphosphate phosphatase [Pseudomonadota bacterium]MBU1386257.1 undecaprenyl-diphosphate phosphatase [Pseudomonadota bacterium]MBU1542950.1 undecaprenyl-diphosphate phosphatase [Pseudomonadota bacterium]MBU2430990.1 undecaprenyl-diphosphate phosphatase [Pseudomonadota bacterium]MBU2479972.1 undecaprenyl-diphosphate phosphatase [Pseudomonadota bacterium]